MNPEIGDPVILNSLTGTETVWVKPHTSESTVFAPWGQNPINCRDQTVGPFDPNCINEVPGHFVYNPKTNNWEWFVPPDPNGPTQRTFVSSVACHHFASQTDTFNQGLPPGTYAPDYRDRIDACVTSLGENTELTIDPEGNAHMITSPGTGFTVEMSFVTPEELQAMQVVQQAAEQRWRDIKTDVTIGAAILGPLALVSGITVHRWKRHLRQVHRAALRNREATAQGLVDAALTRQVEPDALLPKLTVPQTGVALPQEVITDVKNEMNERNAILAQARQKALNASSRPAPRQTPTVPSDGEYPTHGLNLEQREEIALGAVRITEIALSRQAMAARSAVRQEAKAIRKKQEGRPRKIRELLRVPATDGDGNPLEATVIETER